MKFGSVAILLSILIAFFAGMPLQVAGNWQFSCASGDGAFGEEGAGGATVSSTLFNAILSCGCCIEIRCNGTQERCRNGSIIVPVTKFFTPIPASIKNGGWCGQPEIQLLESDFLNIAFYKDVIANVSFRSVACVRTGGINFEMMVCTHYTRIFINNVAGESAIFSVSISTSRSNWQPMLRDGCGYWKSSSYQRGQSLSLNLTTCNNRTLIFPDVIPANWQCHKTYTGLLNF